MSDQIKPKITQGDIILCPFPFSDQHAHKVRPALVVAKKPLDNHVILGFISSKSFEKSPYDIQCKPSSTNGLKVISTIRLSKIVAIDGQLVFGKMGRISDLDIKKVQSILKKIFI